MSYFTPASGNQGVEMIPDINAEEEIERLRAEIAPAQRHALMRPGLRAGCVCESEVEGGASRNLEPNVRRQMLGDSPPSPRKFRQWGEMLNGLDLFSGIACVSEALAPWVRPIAYCEKDDFAQRMLLSRIARGEVPNAPIWDDVTTLRGGMLPVQPDIIYGGFPCQDISLAGARRGLAGKRSVLFWEIVRLTEETAPSFVFLENNWPAIRKFVPTIRAAFECLGYECRDGHLAASDVGFPHRRWRWFLLAHSRRQGRRVQPRRRSGTSREDSLQPRGSLAKGIDSNAYGERKLQSQGRKSPVGRRPCRHSVARPSPDAVSSRLEASWLRGGPQEKLTELASALARDDWDTIAAIFCGMDHGRPYRSNRIGALGNANPPALYRTAFERLCGLK